MNYSRFDVEQWMTDYEMQATYNLTDTCVKAVSLQDLLELEPIDFSMLALDYGHITGDTKTKEEILKLYQTGTIECITTTQGCVQANEIVMHTLLNKEDHVIVCTPGYQQFSEIPKVMGCQVTNIQLDEENRWHFSMDEMVAAIQENTKMIVLNNPNNPTGTYLDEMILKPLIQECEKRGIYILCDEVYQGMDGKIFSISDLYDRGISTSSLSKVYGLAGLRFGWIKSNPQIIEQINLQRDYSMISTGPLVDTLARIALSHKEVLLERTQKIIHTNIQILKDWLKNESHCHVCIPEKGTVSFLKYDMNRDSVSFCKELLEKTGIFFVPGALFGKEYHLRLGLAQDSEQFKKGLQLFSEYMNAMC